MERTGDGDACRGPESLMGRHVLREVLQELGFALK